MDTRIAGIKSVGTASYEQRKKMTTTFPPTPEERPSNSFSASTSDSPTDKKRANEKAIRHSALPTPDSPPRHAFPSHSQDRGQHVRDPLVVPHNDDTINCRPLFADSQPDADLDDQSSLTTVRYSNANDSEWTCHPLPALSSCRTPNRQRISPRADSASPTTYLASAKISPSQTEAQEICPTSVIHKPSTVTVPGTTIVLPNTPDAVLAYYHHNLQEIQGLQRAQREAREPATSASAESFTRDQVNALNNNPTVPTKKRKAAPPVAIHEVVHESSAKRRRSLVTHNPSPPPAISSKAAVSVVPKPKKAPATPRVRASSDFSDRTSQNVKHQRSGPQKKALWPELKMEQWRQADDYCPPFDMNKPIGLKVPPSISTGTNSKKTPAPWSDAEMAKADIEHLHPEELILAKDLRVEPQAYLMTKRRIFAARVRALVEHQNWNKTCAQQAVQMDVNKASRFFLAFDAVNWFNESHFPAHVQDQWRENEKRKVMKA